jgi:hypothetical protein
MLTSRREPIMNPRPFFALAAVLSIVLCGCGGGGGSSSPSVLSAGGNAALNTTPTQFTRTGTFHFNQLSVTALTIQDDSGSILTPINPPDNALEGERITFTFEEAQAIPTFFRPLPQPILLVSLVRL